TAVFNQTTPPAPTAALPVITFSDSATFYLNGETIQVIHVEAAHTDGDAIIVFKKANVIHAGDTYFSSYYPFISGSGGWSLDGMIAAANRILSEANDSTRIIPGHGPIADKKMLTAYRDMLAGTRVRLARAKLKGMSVEQVMNANLFADFDSTWGKGF